MNIGRFTAALTDAPETDAERTARHLAMLRVVGAVATDLAFLVGVRATAEARAMAAAPPPTDGPRTSNAAERMFSRLFRDVRQTVVLEAHIAAGTLPPPRRLAYRSAGGLAAIAARLEAGEAGRNGHVPAAVVPASTVPAPIVPTARAAAGDEAAVTTAPERWLVDFRSDNVVEAGWSNRAARRRAARQGTGPPGG